MKVLELFSGTSSFSNVCKEFGDEVFTVDINPDFNADFIADIMDVTPEMIREKFGQPNVIWASPPCTCFSVASIRHYWKDGKPKNEKTLHAIRIARHTLNLIKGLDPKYWFIENPRGMLRKQDFMPNDKRKFVTYCRYGLPYQKPTDIWTNLDSWQPRWCKPIRGNAQHCHMKTVKDKRGFTRNGVFDLRWQKSSCGKNHIGAGCGKGGKDMRYNDAARRAIVPRELCVEIRRQIEGEK